MALKQFTIDFRKLASTNNIRLWLPVIYAKSKYPLSNIKNFIKTIESGSRPKGGIIDIEDGAISIGGEQINPKGFVDLSNIPLVPIEFYNNSKKGKVKKHDILVCKDGALTGKVCFVDIDFPIKEVMVNEHVYIIRSKSEIANQKFFFYLIYNDFVQKQIKNLAYKKKGQPGLNLDHLKLIKIPCIAKSTQDQIVAQIEPVEKNIKKLRTQITPPQEVINKVFAREFGFDLEMFEELKKIRNYYVDLYAFANNKDVRQSVKFHRKAGIFVNDQLKKITDKKIKDYLSEPIVLGKGISPTDYDDEGDYFYISMANIKNWKFESEDARLVSKDYSDKNLTKTVAKDDILMARSGEGTIGKVALIDDEDLQGIFADFTMRIRLQDYNRLFAYYYFRTDYFQYLIEINKKGLGNNTNIFPSQIQEFPMIDIDLKKQQKIVDEIKKELDNQEEIKRQIETERNKIDEIIENAIK